MDTKAPHAMPFAKTTPGKTASGARDSFLRAAGGAKKGDGDDARLRGAVVPGVASAVLDDAISWLQEDFRAIVQFEIDLPGKNHVEIDRVRGVHGGVERLEDFGESG